MSTSQHGALKDLRQLKRRAKELLRAFLDGSADAVRTVQAHFDGADPSTFRLAQAQLVLARSLGHASWARLRESAGATSGDRRPRTKPAEMQGTYVYDVNAVDGDQAWALFEACRDGDTDAVRALIDADPHLVHAQYWYTQPTHFAVYANQPDVLRILLESGAEPGRSSGWPLLLQRAEELGFDEVHRVLARVAHERFGYDSDFTLLKDAIISRSRDRIHRVLKERLDLAKTCDAHGSNAIHWAVMTRQPDLFPTLRQHGADPNHRRSDGQTPAHLLFNGDYEFRVWRDLKGVSHADLGETLHALLSAGAVVDLSVASATGDSGVVEALLAKDPSLATRLDSGRRNPLMYAARTGHLEIVRTLLDHGAKPSQPEDWAKHGWALWMACATGRVDIVTLLLEHGANPNSAPDSSDSCLGIARARAGTATNEIEQMLRSHGATAATWALNDDELRNALETGASVTHEHWFAEEVLARNDLDLAKLILEKDPDVVHRLHGGTLRLGSPDVAITESAVLRLLLEAGFDPNRPGWLGKTALHHYAGRGETGNAVLVIEFGADIDAVDDEFHGTPLAWAAAKGHADTLRMLLERGANPNLPVGLHQATPHARASAGGHNSVVQMLEAIGGPR